MGKDELTHSLKVIYWALAIKSDIVPGKKGTKIEDK